MSDLSSIGTTNSELSSPLRYVPLGSLRISPRNVRKKSPSRIRELADDIAITGLLQNLVVHDIEDTQGSYGVCAGQRRLAALNLLKSEGHANDSTPVPVRVVTLGEALSVSLIENAQREGMHIADQCQAYHQLVIEGRSIADIAGRFSVTERDVRRALKLASVAPALLEIFRDDAMSYEQVSALALSDDHEQQERIWFDAAQSWQRTPSEIRRVITAEETDASDNPIAAFVGLDQYEEAGGFVRRDLFSDANHKGYISDIALLHRLAAEKLTTIACDMERDGWSWVETDIQRNAMTLMRYGRLRPEQREATRKEKTEARRLEKLREEARAQLDAYYDDDEVEADEAKCDALEKALREASAAIHAYAQRLDVWTEDQKSRAGVYIYVDQYGELQIERGLVKPTDNASTEGQDIAGAQTTPPTKVKPLHGETLCERLSAHRTAAVQAELMAQPTIALAYLMSAMVPRVFCEHYHAAGQHALDVEFRPTHDRLLQVADDMAASKAWLFIDGERQKWRAMLPSKVSDLLPWLLSCSEDVLANLFAFCVSANINGLSRFDVPHNINLLADTLELDMSVYWKATSASYFNHVTKQRIIDVVSHAVSPEVAAPLASMKKTQAAQAAEIRLADSGWLPEVLRNREVKPVWEAPDDETADLSVDMVEE